MRIFPEMWASTLWPFSNSTRNMALGRGSTTVPSSTIASSLGLGRGIPPDRWTRTFAARIRARPGASAREETSGAGPARPNAGSDGRGGGFYEADREVSESGDGEDLRAGLGHADAVLDVGGEGAVLRADGPAVVHQPRGGAAGVQHVLDRAHHAGTPLHARR